MKRFLSVLLASVLCFSLLTLFGGCGSCEHNEKMLKLESTTATCTQGGVETYECKACGKKGVVTKEVEAYGHSFTMDTENNVKCRNCDLLQYDLTFRHVPEVIEVYYQSSSYGVGGKVHMADLTVNEVTFDASGSSINVYVSVTANNVSTNSYFIPQPKLAATLTTAEGTVIDGYTRENRVEEGKTHSFLFSWETNTAELTTYADEQYSFEIDIYDILTCGYNDIGNYVVLSKTMKEA